MNKRILKLVDYGISEKRYKELCGFCEQYPEWQEKLRFGMDTLKSQAISDMPRSFYGPGDSTGNLAVKRAELQKKCDLIEKTAQEAALELSPYVIKNVCYETPFCYLQAYEEIPCSRTAFYDKRRYFFYLLDQKQNMCT